MNTYAYQQYLDRARHQHGDRFDGSDLYPQFRPFFQGPRVRVRTTYDNGETYERTGRVSVTTGWRPAFILIHRSSDHGSSDLLGERDRVVAVQRGRQYVPTVASDFVGA